MEIPLLSVIWPLLIAGSHGYQLGATNIPCGNCMPEILIRQAQPSMDESDAWKPRRKPYIPSWTRGGSNIYREQQSEYSEYAKQQSAPTDSGEATRDPEAHVQEAIESTTAAWAREIEQACAPVHYLCVSDVTDGHAVEGAKDGRALRAEGRELKVLIVSASFNSMSRPARQQVVNRVLADAIKSGALHSVQMRCWAPEEWVEKGSPVDLGAPCSYSSTAGNNHDVEVGPSLGLPGCTSTDEATPPAIE